MGMSCFNPRSATNRGATQVGQDILCVEPGFNPRSATNRGATASVPTRVRLTLFQSALRDESRSDEAVRLDRTGARRFNPRSATNRGATVTVAATAVLAD